jgi:hypothetical protein
MKYSALGDLAKRAVEKVMREGEAKYPNGEGIRKNNHWRRALIHLIKWLIWRRRVDLEHAMTRIAILLSKIKSEGEK